MQLGYVAGEAVPLRWVEHADPKTIFAGEPLHEARFLKTASIRAARCVDCGVGVFTFRSGGAS
jgi:hypothetical protein